MRHCQRTQSVDPVGGMLYESAVRPNKTNVVFFDGFEPDCDSAVVELNGDLVRYGASRMATYWEKMGDPVSRKAASGSESATQ